MLCVFHRRDCTYLDEPQRRKKRKAEAPSNPPGPAEQPAVGGPYVKYSPTLFCFRKEMTDHRCTQKPQKIKGRGYA